MTPTEGSRRRWPRFTMEDVARRGLVVVDQEVFDLARFAARHPGGPGITPLLGTDATRHFLAAHAKSERAAQALRRFKVGEIDAGTLDPEDRGMAALEARFRRCGLFRHRRAWLVADLAGILAPFLLALLCAGVAQGAPLAFALLCLATLHQTYFAHDARHDAIFGQERRARRVVDALGALVLGTTLNPLADEHRLHHAFTNQLGLDEALRVPPVIWHRSMLREHGRRFLRFQALIWLLIVLPLTYPYMVLAGLRYLLRRRQHLLLLGILARWALLALWFQSAALLLLPQALVSSFQALLSSLNHYHMPIAAGPESSHTRTMIARTQNTEGGALWTWLCGGLNFHIEHHLFPTMPRRNYPLIAPWIRRYCEEHGIPYSRCTRWQALWRLLAKLRHPFMAPGRSRTDPRRAAPAEIRRESLLAV